MESKEKQRNEKKETNKEAKNVLKIKESYEKERQKNEE